MVRRIILRIGSFSLWTIQVMSCLSLNSALQESRKRALAGVFRPVRRQSAKSVFRESGRPLLHAQPKPIDIG
jgi:hypothetical protein